MTDEERLLAAVYAAKGLPKPAKELGVAAGFHSGEATKVKRMLRELVRSGVLTREGRMFRSTRASAEPAPSRPGRRGDGGSPFRKGAPARGPDRGPPARRGKSREVVGLLTLRPEGYGF